MSNSLGIDIPKGATVRHKDGTLGVTFGGFGLRKNTSGSAIMVYLDGDKDRPERWDGWDISEMVKT